MKVVKLAILAVCAVFLAPSVARADDSSDASAPAGKNWHLNVGYKLWLTNWTSWTYDYNGNLVSLNDSGVPSHIPNLSFTYKRLLISGSYMDSGNFRFNDWTDDCSGLCPTSLTVDRITAKRKEYDLNVGWYLNQGRNVALTLGYKNIEQNFHDDQTWPVLGYVFSYDSNLKVSGPMLGIVGSANIGGGFSLYGSGAGGWMNLSSTAPAASCAPTCTFQKVIADDVSSITYEAAELGFAWHAKVPLTLTLGYKYQTLDTIFKNTGRLGAKLHGEDTTRGYILGINYTF